MSNILTKVNLCIIAINSIATSFAMHKFSSCHRRAAANLSADNLTFPPESTITLAISAATRKI